MVRNQSRNHLDMDHPLATRLFPIQYPVWGKEHSIRDHTYLSSFLEFDLTKLVAVMLDNRSVFITFQTHIRLSHV
jgi:hypothetical protein